MLKKNIAVPSQIDILTAQLLASLDLGGASSGTTTVVSDLSPKSISPPLSEESSVSRGSDLSQAPLRPIYTFSDFNSRVELSYQDVETIQKIVDLRRPLGTDTEGKKTYLFGLYHPRQFEGTALQKRVQDEGMAFISALKEPHSSLPEGIEPFVLEKGIPLTAELKTTGEVRENPHAAESKALLTAWRKKFFFKDPGQENLQRLAKMESYNFDRLGAYAYAQESTPEKLALAEKNVDWLFIHDDLRDNKESLVGKNRAAVKAMNAIYKAIIKIVFSLPGESLQNKEVATANVLSKVAIQMNEFVVLMKSNAFKEEATATLNKLFEAEPLLKSELIGNLDSLIKKEIVKATRLAEALVDLLIDLKQHIPSSQHAEKLKDDKTDYWTNNEWEAVNREKKKEICLIEYYDKRLGTSAVEETYTMGEILLDIPLLDSLKDSIPSDKFDSLKSLYKTINSSSTRHVVFVNDEFSFMREFLQGVRENYVGIAYARNTLYEAFDQNTKEVNTCFDQFHEAKREIFQILEELKSIIGESLCTKLALKVRIREDWMEGNREWSADSWRYLALAL